MKKWLPIAFLTSAILGSCTDSSFNGTSKVRRQLLGGSGDGLHNSTGGGGTPGGPADSRDSILTNGCLASEPNLYLMFVLDASGSMGGSLNTVKDNIADTVINLKKVMLPGSSKVISNIKFGAVTYHDELTDIESIDLTDNVKDFKDWLGNQGTRGGITDLCEAGIKATAIAMGKMQAALQADPNGLPILIPVTDNYSHDGNNQQGSRTFSTAEILGLSADKTFNTLLLFDSTYNNSDNVGGDSCNNAFRNAGTAPSTKWNDLRNEITTQKAGSSPYTRGQNIAFPLKKDDLIKTLPSFLSQHVKVCPQG